MHLVDQLPVRVGKSNMTNTRGARCFCRRLYTFSRLGEFQLEVAEIDVTHCLQRLAETVIGSKNQEESDIERYR